MNIHTQVKGIFVGLFFTLLMSTVNLYSQSAKPPKALVIEKIEIEGNNKTKPHVIEKYITLTPGNELVPSELLENTLLLQQTELFKDVDIYTRPGSEKGLVIVVIEIIENKWATYRFEGGHGDLNGWYLSPIIFRMDNFFGYGNYFSYTWKLGNRVTGNYFDIKEPNLFNSKAYIGFQFFGEHQDYLHYIDHKDTTETVYSKGIRIKLGANTGVLKHTFLGYRLVGYRPKKVKELEPLLQEDYENRVVGALSTGLITDTRDNTAFPTNGIWGAVTGEVALKYLGSNTIFPKLLFDFRTYKQFASKPVYAFHIKGGLMGNKAPYYERFYLGGASSLRGFSFSRLTPPGWGTKQLIIQNEFRFPIGTPETESPGYKHTLVLFYDAGGIWMSDQIPILFDLYHTIGAGYRLKLPVIDILRFDIAHPLNNIENNFLEFHISLGQTF